MPSSDQDAFCASDAWIPYKMTALQLLKKGGLAVHIDACQDSVTLADGSVVDLWTADPWALVQGLRAGSVS